MLFGYEAIDILKVKCWPVGKLINIEDVFNVSFVVRIKRAQVQIGGIYGRTNRGFVTRKTDQFLQKQIHEHCTVNISSYRVPFNRGLVLVLIE